MNAKNRNRSKHACRIRRSRFHLALLSSALLAYPCVAPLSAWELTERREASQTANLDSTPVLKSVGIRFVNDQNSDAQSVKSAPAISGLLTPRLDTTSASNPSKVIVNSLFSAPTIKMPPMVACTEPKSTLPTPMESATVKMEMASVRKSLVTLEGPSAQLVAAAKPIAAIFVADQSIDIASPSLPTMMPKLLVVETTPASIIAPSQPLATGTNEFPKEPNSLARSISATEPPNIIANSTMDFIPSQTVYPSESLRTPIAASVKAPFMDSKKPAEERSRAANVVRIPSMTLTSKDLENAEQSRSQEIASTKAPVLEREITKVPTPTSRVAALPPAAVLPPAVVLPPAIASLPAIAASPVVALPSLTSTTLDT